MTDTMVLCSWWFIRSDVLIYFGLCKEKAYSGTLSSLKSPQVLTPDEYPNA